MANDPNINAVDVEAYERFKCRHSVRVPTQFARTMTRTDFKFGFELDWWSDDPEILEKFYRMIEWEFGHQEEPAPSQPRTQFLNMPSVRIERDGNTGMQVRSNNYAMHEVCTSIFLRVLREENDNG